MGKISLCYFLEDIAHEKFLRALVTRIARDRGIEPSLLDHEVRNATGGRGKALAEFAQFLRESPALQCHILIVAIDANCQGYQERRGEILRLVKQPEVRWQVVCAVPDPHIERWYLSDPTALPRALGSFYKGRAQEVTLPPYKCRRGWYKQALRRAIEENAGFVPPLGGTEYGQEIAEAMDLYRACKEDRTLKNFVDDLKEAFAIWFSPT